MWAFNDSKTLFMRGKPADLELVKNIIATFETSTATRKSLIQSALADLNFAKTRYGSGLSFTLGEGNLMF